MVRGKHAIQPDRKAQAKKAGAVLTAIVITGSATTEAAVALPTIQNLHTDAASSAPTSSDQVSQKTSVPQPDVTAQADQTVTADPDESLNQVMPSTGEFAENPGTPLPSSISAALPSDAQLVGTHYAQTPDGTIYNVSNGQRTTDPRIVGTADHPADPLAKSDGVHFIPVPVETAREEVAKWARANRSDKKAGQRADQAGASHASGDRHAASASADVTSSGNRDDAVHGTVNPDLIPSARLGDDLLAQRHTARPASNFSGFWNAHWGTIGSEQAFFNRLNQPVIRQAKKGIDISEWQGDINWGAVKNSGVEQVVIRTNAGSGYVDKKADRNLRECLRRGIPFGAYMYSYASNGAEARAEAQVTVRMLRGNGVTPNRLALPVYLDLENFPGHPGTAAYEDVVRSWINEMHRNGYTNVSVYSYTSYLSSTLNSRYIHSQVGWVAQYAGGLQYTAFSGNARGWQYSDAGRIDGIAGNVDLDAFGYGTPAVPYIQSRRILRIPDGEYYIDSALNPAVSVEIPGGATSNGTIVRTYTGNGTVSQRFRFTRNADGTYTIVNTHSGKALDVPGGYATNGRAMQQYTPNGTVSQHWYVREGRGGAVFLQSVLGDYVLDLAGRRTSNGTTVQLWNSGDNQNQQFVLASASAADRIPTNTPTEIRSARDSGKVLDIAGASKNNGAALDLYAKNNTNAQRFVFHSVGNGVYRILNAKSGKAIDVPGGAIRNSTKLQQYTDNGTASQQWYIRDGGNGTVSFFTKNSGRFIDLPGGSTSSGTRVQIYDGNGTISQQFTVVRAAIQLSPAQRLASDHRADLADGTYRFAASQDTGFALEVAGASRSEGGNVQIYRQNATNAQLWNVSHDDQGFVILTNVVTGKTLDLAGGAARNGQNVDQYHANGTASQQWIAVRSQNGIVLHSAVNPDFVLDIAGGSMQDKTNVRVWKANDTSSQRWIIQPPLTGSARSDVLASVHRADLADGAYRFSASADTNFVLDLAGGSSANGANVQIYRSNGTAAQLWMVTHDAKGYVLLRNAASGKMLDLSGGVARNGQNVRQYTANGTRSQEWIAERSGRSIVLRSAVNPDFVLDIAGGSMQDKTNVRVWWANGTSSQRWIS